MRTPSTGDGGGTPLTVHTTKVAELKVRIHRPRRYDDVGAAVRQLKQGIAVTVNFDCLNEPERRRVCDFLNGACYVLHGTARDGVDCKAGLNLVYTNFIEMGSCVLSTFFVKNSIGTLSHCVSYAIMFRSV